MKRTEVTISKKSLKIVIGSVIFVILLVLAIKFPLSESNAASIQVSDFPAGSPEKFAMLSNRGTQESVNST